MITRRIRNMTKLSAIGFTLSVFSIIGALVIGYNAYRNTFNRIEKQHHEFYLREAKMLVQAVESLSREPDRSVLRFLENLWGSSETRPEDEYICVVDEESRLVLHTANPASLGNYAGDNPILDAREPDLTNLADLVKYQKDYVGDYISSAGQDQIAAFAAVPEKKWVFGLHRSKSAFEKEIDEGLQGFEIGFLLVCAVLMPLSLSLLYITFHSIQKRQTITEMELRESEERYRHLVDSSLNAILVYRQDEILFANEPFYDIFGYEQDDLRNIVVDDILAPEIAYQVAETRRQRLAGEIEHAAVYESKGRRKNGELFDMEISVTRSHYLGEPCCITTLSDISGRKKSEKALIENELRVRTLFDLSPQPILVVEVDSGRIIDINNKYCELLQYTKEELIGKRVIDLGIVTAEDRKRYLAELKEVGEVLEMEMDHRKKDSTFINTLAFSKRLDLSGEDIAITILFDVTERKWLETQLQQAQKMEAVGTLAGGIAHDFNNILGIIIGNTELAIGDIPEWNPARHNLDEVYQACMRARDVVRQILTFSRQGGPQLKPFRIGSIIKDSLKLMRSSIPSTIDIRQSILAENDTVNANPTQINQVLINLCTNATHAMENRGGTLDVTLEATHLDKISVLAHPELKPGNYIALTVADTGSGIASKNLEKIFDPYFTTKEVGKGTGMGLAVVHAIVKNHGGTITVSSKIGGGTSFRILLPIIESEAESEEETPEQFPGGRERVLLVDDEKEMVKTIGSLLERLGYSVTAMSESEKALEAFMKNPSTYDLVITDMTMPQMTGDRLAKEILHIRPDIPIILCTGYSGRIDARAAKKIGIQDLLMKPIIMSEMAITIRSALDRE